jgi:hypothetical protein
MIDDRYLEDEMRNVAYKTLVVCGLIMMWVMLMGSDGGCQSVQLNCDELGETACVDSTSCRPVYTSNNNNEYAAGVDCIEFDCKEMPEEVEQVFDHCEEIPDCTALAEEACNADPACQAIYEFSEDWYGMDGQTRCIMPPLEFAECLNSDADPCDGLEEAACQRRPVCEVLYNYPDCYAADEACLEYEYEGCQVSEYPINYDDYR